MNKFAKIALGASAFALLTAGSVYAQAADQPTLKVVTPSEGQTIYGTKVPVLIAADNFQIVDYNQYKTSVAGQGHVHLWLDDANPTPESAAKVTSNEFTYSDVPVGDHTLAAELVNNNHTSLNPPQKTTVNFKTADVASPTPVTTSGFDKKTALIILVIVAAVIVAAWWYTKEEDIEAPQTKTAPKAKKKPARRKSKGKRA